MVDKVKIETQPELKPSPTLDLRGKVGTKVVGVFKKRIPSKLFPGKFSALIQVEETDGSTKLWNPEKKVEEEVTIAPGDVVFLQETVVLERAFIQIPEGAKIEVIYRGEGIAKAGQKAPFLYDVNQFKDK